MASLNEMALLYILEAMEEAEDLNSYRRTFNIRANPFEISDRKFIQIFRMNKSMVDDIVGQIDPYMSHSATSWGLETSDKLLASLRFFAAGAHQVDVSCNQYCAMSQSSVSKSINETVNAFEESGLLHQWIHFPQNLAQLNNNRAKFMEMFRFPGAVGCIDCTHVSIFPPNNLDPEFPEHIYVNRKSYHSINVQLICDADKKIINVNAKFPGSTGDGYIWSNSNVNPIMEELYRRYPNSYYLLGDSGYGLRPWLLTPPEEEPTTLGEKNYNKIQKGTRTIIEHVNGILKMRWRCCLGYRTLHYKPVTASKIINTCCVLHNMCMEAGLPAVPPDTRFDDPLEGLNVQENIVAEPLIIGRVNPDLAAGRMLQRKLIQQYFTRFR